MMQEIKLTSKRARIKDSIGNTLGLIELGDAGLCLYPAERGFLDGNEKLQLKLQAAESALRGFQVCYTMLQRLPELNMINYLESDVQALNDGVCNICCEMKAVKASYDKSLNQINLP